ncbi:MAG: TlpA disulfide reductase family protein [Telluria sp.]
MTGFVHIGPLAMPAAVLVVGLAILASTGASYWFRRYRGIDVEPVLWKMIFGGLLAARAAFVLSHLDVYAGAPLDALDIRDGGFVAPAGILAGFLIGAALSVKLKTPRKPLVIASLAGMLVWMAGTLAVHDFDPARSALPEVELRRLDGSPVQLRSLAGKPMVVNLWATWCPPCRREMPALRDAQASNPDVQFVFINQGEDAEKIRRFLAAERLELANVFSDRMGATAKKTGASGFPTTLFYDGQGRLVSRRAGELSRAVLDERIAALRKP